MPDSESRNQRIRELAYLRWEEQGRQDGRDAEYWQWAEAAVANEEAAQLPGSNGDQAPVATMESPGADAASKTVKKPRAQPKPPPVTTQAAPAKKPAQSAPAPSASTKPPSGPSSKSTKPTRKR